MSRKEAFETVSQLVCGKPKGVSSKKCHQTKGQSNPLCSLFKKCRIAQKSKEQLGYVLSPNNSDIYLEACPGSGKTESVALKAAYTISSQKQKHSGIAVLTFTNNAASVIHDRVCQFTGASKARYPHFIGTIDSWLHGFIAHPFSHIFTEYEGDEGDRSIKIVEDNRDDPWLNAFKLKTPYCSTPPKTTRTPLYANNIKQNMSNGSWEIRKPSKSRSSYISDKSFYTSDAFTKFKEDKESWLTLRYLRQGFEEAKDRFLKKGFATYQDIENTCLWLLHEYDYLCELISLRFPLIIIDECQDLSSTQMAIFNRIRQHGSKLHFVGDLAQGIYGFKEVHPDKVKKFVENNDFKVLTLTKNFRSNQAIVETCQRLIASKASLKGMRDIVVDHPCICLTYPSGQIGNLASWFENHLSANDLISSNAVIVARGRGTLRKIRPTSVNMNFSIPEHLAAAISLWQTECPQSLEDALKHLGKTVATILFPKQSTNAQKCYLPESIPSAVNWRIFLSKVLAAAHEQKTPMVDLSLTWKKWTNQVRIGFLKLVTQQTPFLGRNVTLSSFPKLTGSNFRSPRGVGENTVSTTIPQPAEISKKIMATTIHGVKGETFDSVMVVSAPDRRTDDGHWTHWLETPQSEAARIAYVASSRPKHLLVWAIPNPETDDYTQFEELGFKMVQMKTVRRIKRT